MREMCEEQSGHNHLSSCYGRTQNIADEHICTQPSAQDTYKHVSAVHLIPNAFDYMFSLYAHERARARHPPSPSSQNSPTHSHNTLKMHTGTRCAVYIKNISKQQAKHDNCAIVAMKLERITVQRLSADQSGKLTYRKHNQ